jgi:hypothetical protein
VLLEAIPADQAGLAGGLPNAGRQTGGALAVALYGALVSGSFLPGMHASLLISAALLVASSAAALLVLRAERGAHGARGARSAEHGARSTERGARSAERGAHVGAP